MIVTGSSHLRMRIATVHINAAANITLEHEPARVLCRAYSRAAFIRGAAFIQRYLLAAVFIFEFRALLCDLAPERSRPADKRTCTYRGARAKVITWFYITSSCRWPVRSYDSFHV